MKKNIVYILGLFEDQKNLLFQHLKEELSSDVKCHYLAPFSIDKFGTESFDLTIKQTQSFINTIKPEIIIAHSLGAYTVIHISTNKPLILLDPSLEISNIVRSNLKKYNNVYFYDDGLYKIKLSSNFIASLKTIRSFRTVSKKIQTQIIDIFGAGRGGYKIANQYHQYIPHSHYKILPTATHEFKNKKDQAQIISLIKKRLDIKSSR